MPQFFETQMGRRFFERDVPQLVEAAKKIPELITSVNNLTTELARHNELLKRQQYAELYTQKPKD